MCAHRNEQISPVLQMLSADHYINSILNSKCSHLLSHGGPFGILWTVVHQASLSLEFSRQESSKYWCFINSYYALASLVAQW